MLRACWCNASGNTGTTKVSDVGPEWYFLHTIPSTMSSCDQSWAYLLNGVFFKSLCGGRCSEWSALYSCRVFLSCCGACLISSAVKPACTVVRAAWSVSLSGPLLRDSVSAFPLVVPFRYTISKLHSCIARAQRHRRPSIFCSPSHCRGAWSVISWKVRPSR